MAITMPRVTGHRALEAPYICRRASGSLPRPRPFRRRLMCGWPLPGKRKLSVPHRSRLQSCVRPVHAVRMDCPGGDLDHSDVVSSDIARPDAICVRRKNIGGMRNTKRSTLKGRHLSYVTKTRAISQCSSVAANHHHRKPRNNWMAITPHATPKIPTNKRLPCANARPAAPPASRESPNSSPRSGSIRGAFILLALIAP
jgi:hypothetical protein